MTNWHRVTLSFVCFFLLISQTAEPHANDAPSTVGETLTFLTWADYIDPSLVQEFEAKNGAKVRLVYFAADDARNDIMVETGGQGYDVILVSGTQMSNYRKQGWIMPLEENAVPNLRHLDPKWRETFGGAVSHGAPYFWGTLGIAFRRDLVSEPITSWMQFFRPAEALRGRIAMVKNGRDCISMALLALGHSINSTGSEELNAAEKLLLEQKPFVHSYTYVSLGKDSDLLNGNVVAALVYSGDALILRGLSADIGYVVPREGSSFSMDYLTVSSSSPRKDLALRFINFIIEPENVARNALFIHYATPYKTSEKYLPAEYFQDTVIYPPKEVQERIEFDKEMSPRQMKRHNEIFSHVLAK